MRRVRILPISPAPHDDVTNRGPLREIVDVDTGESLKRGKYYEALATYVKKQGWQLIVRRGERI